MPSQKAITKTPTGIRYGGKKNGRPIKAKAVAGRKAVPGARRYY